MIPALLLSIVPLDFTARESVEMIETNHVFTYDGERHLSQIVFWNRDGVLAWRMDNEGVRRPVGKTLYFMDGGVVRCITARTLAESWTMYDVEVADRDLLPSELRRELKNRR